MPKQSSSSSGGRSSGKSSGGSTGTSNYQYTKSGGGWPNFMASYGLKQESYDDAQEGNAIMDGFRAVDAANGQSGGASSQSQK
ncbi:hypothetical protein BC834DRAFT_901664 [Gloeopeniophorella convolvens]|nr:hypothetical protein BC834DRAFT_901664 [Gloeopeniophorella convolvens]